MEGAIKGTVQTQILENPQSRPVVNIKVNKYDDKKDKMPPAWSMYCEVAYHIVI